mmetsp:Transcript_29743/g.101122  ORF Transcript_29743/g.101122 Transcript_29743/m.101122 type:complete len:318 (-) Transcript_29743:558-1511(-)
MLPQSPANITPAEQSEPGFTIRAAFLLWWDIQESMQRFIKSTFAVRLGADGSSCLAKRIRAAWAKSLRDQTGLRKFMHRCDCKYKIMRQIAAYRDEIIKTIDTPHTSAGMIAEDAVSKSAIFSPVSMVWPSYAEKPWGGAATNDQHNHKRVTKFGASCDIFSTTDMELRLHAYIFTVRFVDSGNASNSLCKQLSINLGSDSTAKGPSKPLNDALLRHDQNEHVREIPHALENGIAKHTACTSVGRLPRFSTLIDPVHTNISILRGRLAKYSTYKQHLMHIPHALVVAQGELYLLFNCYARFPLYWADELNAKSSPMI